MNILSYDKDLVHKILEQANTEVPIILAAREECIKVYLDNTTGHFILDKEFEIDLHRVTLITSELYLNKGTNADSIKHILKQNNLFSDFTITSHSDNLIQLFTPKPVKGYITENLWV